MTYYGKLHQAPPPSHPAPLAREQAVATAAAGPATSAGATGAAAAAVTGAETGAAGAAAPAPAVAGEGERRSLRAGGRRYSGFAGGLLSGGWGRSGTGPSWCRRTTRPSSGSLCWPFGSSGNSNRVTVSPVARTSTGTSWTGTRTRMMTGRRGRGRSGRKGRRPGRWWRRRRWGRSGSVGGVFRGGRCCSSRHVALHRFYISCSVGTTAGALSNTPYPKRNFREHPKMNGSRAVGPQNLVKGGPPVRRSFARSLYV